VAAFSDSARVGWSLIVRTLESKAPADRRNSGSWELPLTLWIGPSATHPFDLDGVLTPTADVQIRARRQMFSTCFVGHHNAPACSKADYLTYVDGRPRYDGVRGRRGHRGA
jgi:hypothetical protein